MAKKEEDSRGPTEQEGAQAADQGGRTAQPQHNTTEGRRPAGRPDTEDRTRQGQSEGREEGGRGGSERENPVQRPGWNEDRTSATVAGTFSIVKVVEGGFKPNQCWRA